MSCSCGCCTGTRTLTPAPISNAPGLSAIRYRSGTHALFVASQLARLSSRNHPALAGLTTREPDDPAIALLDCWGIVADVLTFYQERIANEGYLRTATEPESLTALGRLVGHEPRPALGSSAYLAYSLDPPGAKGVVPAGTQSKSLAAPGEQPQTFETSEALDAREEWNELLVRRTRPPGLDFAAIGALTRLELSGVTANAKPGDRMVFVFDATNPSTPPLARIVNTARADFERDRTTVSFSTGEPVAEYDAAVTALARAVADARQARPRNSFGDRLDEVYLLPLETALESRPTAKDVTAPLYRLLGALTEEREIARARAIAAVSAWPALDEVIRAGSRTVDAAVRTARISHPEIERLRSLAGDLSCPHPDGPGSSSGTRSARRRGDRERRAGTCDEECANAVALVGLLPILPALRKRPTRPPAGARALAREVCELYGTESDTLPKLLALADPKLGETLYQAWADTDLAEPSPLSSLQLMRQRAKPFGANAALPLVVEGSSSDWTFDALGVKETLTAEVTYRDGKPVSARLTHTGADTATATATIPDLTDPPTSVALGPGEVVPGKPAGTRGGVRLTFGGGLPRRTMSFWDERNDQVEVHVRKERQVGASLFARESEDLVLGSDRITISRAAPVVRVSDVITPATYVLPLDASYEGITAGGLVVVERPGPGAPRIIRIAKVEEVSLARYGLTGPSTQLTLEDPWADPGDTFAVIRETTVFVRGEAVETAGDPIPGDVGGGEIELERMYDGLEPGRWLVVSGERTDVPFTTGVRASELVMLGGVRQTVDPDSFGERTHTTLELANELAYTYRRETVTVRGNVVEATQGQHRTQVLGSGDATKPNQSFTLTQSPVTWLPTATPDGAESTLVVRVDGVRRHRTDSLVRLGPTGHGYVTRTGSDGSTTVAFGDGRHGARLPTGTGNVTAEFRLGAGRPGNVPVGAINHVVDRPSGVNAVINPLPATGGTDADGPDDARATIPLRIQALDRLVSVRDYEDFARARAGIGKASATQLADGRRHVVHLTVAGAGDSPIDQSSLLLRTLEASLAEFGDPHLPVRVDLRELVLIVLSAGIAVLPDHSWELVEPAVRGAVLERFSFRRRELGEPAYLSEAVAAIQAVEGVDHVDVDTFGRVPGEVDPTELVTLADSLTGAAPCVPAHPARYEERHHDVVGGDTLTSIAIRYGLTLAELLRLNPAIEAATPLSGNLLVGRGVRPAQLAVLPPGIPETLILRRIS